MRLYLIGILTCAFAWLASAQKSACHAVSADWIHGADLAAALPALNRVPPEVTVAAMPMPGSRRTISSSELLAIAQRYGIRMESAPELCFDWSMVPLGRDQVLHAMQDALQIAGARIEIIETSTYAVPKGRVEFERAHLGTPASPEARAAVLWRGDVVYGGGRRYAIWARIRIAAPCQRILAAVPLKAGVPVAPEQLRITPAECFPEAGKPAASPSDLAGLVPLRPIASGTEIHTGMLAAPNDVNRGDVVQVEVISGGARLALTARAETAGRKGDLILIRNPSSNRTFQARVSGKERALVLASAAMSY